MLRARCYSSYSSSVPFPKEKKPKKQLFQTRAKVCGSEKLSLLGFGHTYKEPPFFLFCYNIVGKENMMVISTADVILQCSMPKSALFSPS